MKTLIKSKQKFIKTFSAFSLICAGTSISFESMAVCTTTVDNPSGSTITTGLRDTVADTCLTNEGTINSTTTTFPGAGLRIGYSGSSAINSGIINSSGASFGGILASPASGALTMSSIINTGTINASAGTGSYGGIVVTNVATVQEVFNSGTITSTNHGIMNLANGRIITLTNIGTITASSPNGAIHTDNAAPAIVNLNNLQGASSGVALTFSGKLPTNYNIIVNSTADYGQLLARSTTGTTAFGIYAGGASGVAASTITANRYLNVLQGFSSLSNVTGTTGTYNGFRYSLVADASLADSWDLLVTSAGPTVEDTQASLVKTANALSSTYALQNSIIANSLSYDCTLFDKNDICVSGGARNTSVDAGGLNNVSALLVAAYRAIPDIRLGAYLDQNLSVNNGNSPIKLGVGAPLFGLFGVWNQNPDGTETEVRVSAAYGQKNVAINRTALGTSEAGLGSTSLNNSGIQAIAKYGFALDEGMVVSPYAGIRYSQGNLGGYTETTSATVTTPLTYAAINTNSTTFLAGVHGKFKASPVATIQASVGLESDLVNNNGALSASGVTGLTTVNFNPTQVKTRPVAMLGGYYDVEKNQRIGVTGIWRQEPFQAIGSTTVMATYTVGL